MGWICVRQSAESCTSLGSFENPLAEDFLMIKTIPWKNRHDDHPVLGIYAQARQ
jgi:hypothetical protein